MSGGIVVVVVGGIVVVVVGIDVVGFAATGVVVDIELRIVVIVVKSVEDIASQTTFAESARSTSVKQ